MKTTDFSIPNKVIIWGNDNSNTLAVLRQLAANNINTFLVINKANKLCATKSKYCKTYKVTKDFHEGLQYIIDTFSHEKPKPILFCTGDLSAEQIDQHRNELSNYFYIQGTTEQGLVTKVLDKNYMVTMANKHGIVVPQSIEYAQGKLYDKVKEAERTINDVVYPCLIKPAKNVLGEAKEFKTKICHNNNELQTLLDTLNKRKTYLIQDYIKREYDVVVYGCRCLDGHVEIPGAAVRLRGGEDGDTTYGYLTPNVPKQININSIQSFLEDISFYGIFSFEYGIAEDKAYFWEVNLRNDATSMWFGDAEANIPLLWVMDVTGNSISTVPRKIKCKAFFINEVEDYKHVKKGVVSKQQWRKELSEATLLKFRVKGDTNPYKWQKLYEFVRNIYHQFRR